jgi:hypothetical protein
MLASATTRRADRGCAALRSSRMRRKMFSTPTTASSTSSPMAMARPPKVMVLMERPANQNTIAVTNTDIGIATSEMSVVRASIRNKNSTMPTMTSASKSTVRTLPIEFSMKVAWRNCTSRVVMPAGSVVRIESRVRSSSRVSARVSTPGCFWMPRITAGLPPNPALPRRGRAP